MNDVFKVLKGRLNEAFNQPSPFVKQSATIVAFGVALIVLLLLPADLELEVSQASTLAGVGLIFIATAVSLWFSRVPSLTQYALLIPALDLVGIGLFRAGTGGFDSVFQSLLILPVIWIGSGDGRKYIAYAGLGTVLAFMMPFLLGVISPSGPVDVLRGIFAASVFTVAAAIVNELARQARFQLDAVKTMADEKEVVIHRALTFAAQLQESESKYRAADRLFRGVWAAVTEQSVIGTDVTGLIDIWNPGATKTLGPTADEAEDKLHVFDFHLPEELENRARELNYPPGETVLNPGFSALVENARLGKSETREWTYVRTDGSHVPVELSVTRRVDEDGNTVGYLFVATDETQAREVARLKDEFVGLISHELRTPLSSILGYLELLRDDEDQPLTEEQLKYLGVAERNAHRLLRLVGDLLFTAQVESGKFPLELREVELETIVSASVETAKPLAAAAGIELHVELPDARAIVTGDPTRLGQALDNLVSNAVKFTPRDGSITIGLGIDGPNVIVTVRDTGMGIPEAELDKLFSRFFRATTATRNAVPGVGLGLTITKAIITAHGGEMGVRSEEGVGTEFSVTLPLARVAATV